MPWFLDMVMPLAIETRHLWLGGLALVAVATSVQVRGAVYLNRGGMNLHRATLTESAAAGEQTRRAGMFADRAVATDPRNSRAHVLAATIRLIEGDVAAAVPRLEQAVALEPDNAGVRLQLAEAYHDVGAEASALSQWRASKATPLFLQQGMSASVSGDFTKALEYFQRATQIDPSSYDAWVAVGRTFASIGSVEEARLAYVQAIERQPGGSAGYEGLATLFSEALGRPDEAATIVSQGIAHADSPSPGLFLLRSRLAATRGDYDAAEQDARHAIVMAPRQGTALAWLGELYYRQQRYPEALAQYARTERDASDPVWRWRSYRRIGQTYAAQEDWDGAVAAYRQALEVSRTQRASAQVLSQNHMVLGEALRSRGDRELAIAELEKALLADPANDRAARWLSALRRP